MLNLFRLLAFLLKASEESGHSKALIGVILLAGVIAGLASTALLAVINTTLNGSEAGFLQDLGVSLQSVFLGLCVLLPISRFASQSLLVKFSQDVVCDLRLRLCGKILSAPLRNLEKAGAARLLGSLTNDVGVISQALTQIPLLCLQTTVVIGCLCYMAWLSLDYFLLVLGAVVIGVVSYQIPFRAALLQFRRSRRAWDEVMKHFRGVIEGAKELKIHRPRRNALMAEKLHPAVESVRFHNVRGGWITALANSWGQVLFFLAIGLILYALPDFRQVSREVVSGYILTILYMLTPLDVILSTFQALGRAAISVLHVEELGLTLDQHSSDAGSGRLPSPRQAWERLEMIGCTHRYYREDVEDDFILGPLQLKFTPGELTFMAGGNGSGKTTLAKLLTGLYIPEEGEIQLDGEPISEENRDSYRQLFSVVFSDFFLFDTLLGIDRPDLDDSAKDYLAQLHLGRRVKVENGALSTTELSHGQRKRLVLLTAFLEDRQIYIFDEWAADQDPYFKEIFYLQILPQLKKRGKTVLVISHDDRYYDVADRIIKLDYGQIVYDGPVEGCPLRVSGQWSPHPGRAADAEELDAPLSAGSP